MGRGESTPGERGEAHGEREARQISGQLRAGAAASKGRPPSLKLRLNKRTRVYVCSLARGNYVIRSRHFPLAAEPPRIYVKDHLRQTGWLLISVNRRQDLQTGKNYQSLTNRAFNMAQRKRHACVSKKYSITFLSCKNWLITYNRGV